MQWKCKCGAVVTEAELCPQCLTLRRETRASSTIRKSPGSDPRRYLARDYGKLGDRGKDSHVQAKAAGENPGPIKVKAEPMEESRKQQTGPGFWKRLLGGSQPSRTKIARPAAAVRRLSDDLIDAIHNGRNEDVRLLIAKGADVNFKRSGRNQDDRLCKSTPLLDAAELGHKELIEILLAHGAGVDAEDELGLTALWRVRGKDNHCFSLSKVLLEYGANPNHRDSFGGTLLCFYAEFGNKAMVELLVAYRADVNAPKASPTCSSSNEGRCPLHEAMCTTSSKDVVGLLLSNGANVHAKDRHGYTPLHFAHSADIAQLLIANGADVNAKDKSGDTPLHLALNTVKEYKLIELLLANGAQVNGKGLHGWTPLHFAARGGDENHVRLLLARGADINAQDCKSNTPLAHAKVKHNTKVADLLSATAVRDFGPFVSPY